MVLCVCIDEVGALPSENVFGAFGQHGFESHLGDCFANRIGIDQLRVAEDTWTYPKLLLNDIGVHFHLFDKLIAVDQ